MTTVVRRRDELAPALSGLPRPLHLVPTMGALHAGHAFILRAARAEAATVVLSLFVNPLQFDDPGDLTRYPRPFEADLAVAEAEGVDLVWAPHDREMYPSGRPLANLRVPEMSIRLEAVRRPGHFEGVAMVVSKLLHQVGPDAVWFGRKDAQQLALVRRIVLDLDFPTEVRDHPTVRARDGLALSSRNVLLSETERLEAGHVPAGLFAAAEVAESGVRDAPILEKACGPNLEYAALVDADRFRPLDYVTGRAVLAVAARVGPVRLIDNVLLTLEPGKTCVSDRGITLEDLF